MVLFDDELDGFALAEAAEALGLDRGLVDEEIVAAVVGGDEPESLLLVEPLHRSLHLTLCHFFGSKKP